MFQFVTTIFLLSSLGINTAQALSERPSKPLPLAFTMYSVVSDPTSRNDPWMTNRTGTCESLLSYASESFEAATFVADFSKWHQGNPASPPEQPHKGTDLDGYIDVEPAPEAYAHELFRCLSLADSMGFAPLTVKIKLMDYSAPDSDGKSVGYWRARAPFDPLKGNFSTNPLGPIGLARQLAQWRSQHLKSGTVLIVSVNDEYVDSIRTYPKSWAHIHRELKGLFSQTSQMQLAVNLDWSFTRYVTLFNRHKLREAFVPVDLIGWSLYRPFMGSTVSTVMWEQKKFAKDLRKSLDFLGLTKTPQAILEFGVNHKLHPSDWNEDNLSREDQALAYEAWLQLLMKSDVPVSTVFTFWFGSSDPRGAIPDKLKNYKLFRAQSTQR